MTQQDKELLLKDLCARLPYGINCEYQGKVHGIVGFNHGKVTIYEHFQSEPKFPFIEEVKPYLFPLSSMTEEQRKELWNAFAVNIEVDFQGDLYLDNTTGYIHISEIQEYHNYLIKNHFDINNLIKRGLAIDATGLNIY